MTDTVYEAASYEAASPGHPFWRQAYLTKESAVTACPVAAMMLGDRFVQAVDRYVHHPASGQVELRPEVTTVLSAKYPTRVVLSKADGLARQPVVMTVQRSASPDLIICHVVDYSDNAVSGVDTADRLAHARARGSARMITAFARRFGVDEVTAYAILQYDADWPLSTKR